MILSLKEASILKEKTHGKDFLCAELQRAALIC